jgi:hypothetical protein
MWWVKELVKMESSHAREKGELRSGSARKTSLVAVRSVHSCEEQEAGEKEDENRERRSAQTIGISDSDENSWSVRWSSTLRKVRWTTISDDSPLV